VRVVDRSMHYLHGKVYANFNLCLCVVCARYNNVRADARGQGQGATSARGRAGASERVDRGAIMSIMCVGLTRNKSKVPELSSTLGSRFYIFYIVHIRHVLYTIW